MALSIYKIDDTLYCDHNNPEISHTQKLRNQGVKLQNRAVVNRIVTSTARFSTS